MITQQFRDNRARFSHQDLAPYRGQWVAFTPDGRRLLAGADALELLAKKLRAAGHHLQDVVFDRIPGAEEGIHIGGAELH
jgi:hypothetical protein